MSLYLHSVCGGRGKNFPGVKMINRAINSGDGRGRVAPEKTRPPRLAFIFGAKAAADKATQSRKPQKRRVERGAAERGDDAEKGHAQNPIVGGLP